MAAARALLLFNVFILVLGVRYLFGASLKLLSKGLWLNPLPICVGMFIHSLLQSRQAEHVHSYKDWRDYADRHPDLLWQGILIAVGLVSVIAAG